MDAGERRDGKPVDSYQYYRYGIVPLIRHYVLLRIEQYNFGPDAHLGVEDMSTFVFPSATIA